MKTASISILFAAILSHVCLSVTSAAEPQTAEEFIKRAEEHAAKWRFRDALPDANAALKLSPDSAQAYLLRGIARAHLNENEEAIRDLDKAEKLGGRTVRLLGERAEAFRIMELYDKALAVAAEAIILDPTYVWAYIVEAQTKVYQDKYKEALAEYDRAIELDPKSHFAYYRRAWLKFDYLDDEKGGFADLNHAIELDPTMGVYYVRRAIFCTYYRRHYAQAIRDFTKGIELYPKDDFAYCQRGYFYRDTRYYAKSVEDFTKAIELDPSNPDYIAQRGISNHRRRWYGTAKNDFNKCLKMGMDDQTTAEVLILRAEIHRRYQHYSAAMSDLSRVFELFSDSTDALFQRAVVYQHMYYYKRSLADYEVLQKRTPKHFEVWWQAATIKSILGDNKGALADYNKAVETNPQRGEGYISRARLKIMLGNKEGALTDLTKAQTCDLSYVRYGYYIPGKAIVHATIAQIFEKAKEYEKALTEYNLAIEAHPKYATALASRGIVKSNLGDHEGAIEDCTAAIKRKPDLVMPYIYRGICKKEYDFPEQAIDDFNAALKINPGSRMAYFWRGWSMSDIGDYEKAIADYNIALRLPLDPHAIDDLNHFAGKNVNAKNEGPDETVAAGASNSHDYLVRSGSKEKQNVEPEYNPIDILLLLLRGDARKHLGNYAGALEECNNVIKLNPNYSGAYRSRASIKMFKHDSKGAAEDLEQALMLDTDVSATYLMRARLNILMSDFDKALADLNKAAENDAHNHNTFNYRAGLLTELNEFNSALADCRKARESQFVRIRDDAELQIWVIQSLQGKKAEADKRLRGHFAERHPDPKIKKDWPACIALYLLGDRDEAAILADAAQPGKPLDSASRLCDAHYYTSILRLRDGNEAGALVHFRKAVETNAFDNDRYALAKLRVGVADGTIPSPLKPENSAWRANLPKAETSLNEKQDDKERS